MIIQSKSGINLVNLLRYVRYHRTSSDEWHDPWGRSCDESIKIMIIFCLYHPPLPTEYLSTYFYAYTESKLLGYDIQILTDMWPWECAMQCVNSFAYTCRSFDYDRENRICHMSTNTALEVGGLTPTQDTSPFDYYERGKSCVLKLFVYKGQK